MRPRWLGGLLAAAGVLYFTASAGRLLAIDAVARVAFVLIIPAGLCDLTMTLWLLVAPLRKLHAEH